MDSPFVLPVEVSTLDKTGMLLEVSMSKRIIKVLDLHGKVYDYFLNTKYYYKSFILFAKSALRDDILIPVMCGEDGEYGEVVLKYYAESEYREFEDTYNIKVDYLRSIYDLYISSLQDVDTFELPDLTPEELRIVDELNESLYDMQKVG